MPSPRPPLLATLLVRLSTLKGLWPSIAGDLEEEYRIRLSATDKLQADAWYWRQALTSLPHLALTAARQAQIITLISATIAGYFMVAVVDMYVARSAASAYASANDLDSYLVPRIIYFTVKLAGVALAGALIAALTFRKGRRFWQNVRERMLPLSALLVLPATWLLIFQSADYSPVYRLVWLMGIVPCLLAGAWASGFLATSKYLANKDSD